jgi:pimeloyl-ACP methyl ester carboxylesterase
LEEQRMQKEFNNASLIIYRGTGHALHWEEPQRFVADLIQFLKQVTNNNGKSV